MLRISRPRQLAMMGAAAVLVLFIAGCGQEYPNSTFNHTTEFNAAIDSLWDKLLFWGVVVFVITEGILIYTVVRFRRRPNSPDPKHVHGNTLLELTWTLAPAVILVFIAVPTVRTIFRTQARAAANALQVDVIGHQWWWEFRYPQYGVITANELYLPIGRTVNFNLRTVDVLHSFWIPQLGGKRDLITNRVNHLWFTIDSTMRTSAFNGSCNEYCGTSHANMKFRTFAVSTTEFESWAAAQRAPAVGSAVPAPAATDTARPPAAPDSAAAAAPVQAQSAGYVFPREQLPAHAIPTTPVPASLNFPDDLTGDAARGKDLVTNPANLGKAPCLTCHAIRGAPQLVPDTLARGPNLTHFGSRVTLGAGLFPNDDAHLARWIKSAGTMKPGVTMPSLGRGVRDPRTKTVVAAPAGLTDQEIADIVAYLRTLK
jgi:cytochrome c oxidase subunit II